MRSLTAAGIAAGLMMVLASARLSAQDHPAQPAAPKAAAQPIASPAAPAPAPSSSRKPVIAPAKPVVAPGIGPRGDSGAVPTAARSANARTLSVSARQAAEQTIAALVAAMKSMPKRPPAPPEARTSRARGTDAAAHGQTVDAPPPITYHVTWPATPPEPGLGRRVELDWHAPSTSAPVALRWNEPTPE